MKIVDDSISASDVIVETNSNKLPRLNFNSWGSWENLSP